MVAIHSMTTHKVGVDAVGELAIESLPPGFTHQRIHQTTFGDHHVLHRPGHAGALRVVLSGHLDTLCPPNPTFCSMSERGDRLVGPGVMDMKGGDVVLIWALRALHAVNRLDELDITVIFNSDEELGSPTSRDLFLAMEGRADLALVFEASSPSDSIVTTRRGVVRNRLTIDGVEHHFGMLTGRKVSAIEEAAYQILRIENLNRQDGSVAANVGKVEGGLAANKVAHRAVIEFETRCWDPALHAEVAADFPRMFATPTVEGCRITLERLAFRPPMELRPGHRHWFDLAAAAAAELRMPLVEERRGGVSDACVLSAAGIPTLDGLGPRGDHDFTPDEYCVTESLYERIELTSLLLVRASEHYSGRIVTAR
jgi:glutamate carboxypeptidase